MSRQNISDKGAANMAATDESAANMAATDEGAAIMAAEDRSAADMGASIAAESAETAPVGRAGLDDEQVGGLKARFGLTRSAEYDGVSDDSLVDLVFRNGSRDIASADGAAFTELFCRYADLMLCRIAGMRPCGLDADDLIQECSIGLLMAARSYSAEGGASFRTYATVCIDNRLRSLRRGVQRNGQRPLNDYIELSELGEAGREPTDPAPDPETLVLITESVSELRERMLSMLSETEFRVFTEYLSGTSYGAIAEKLGISAKSVDNAIQRARRKLMPHD